MQLGAFSVSLAVKDLAASKAFYKKLGFKSLMDPHPDDWVILKNGDHIIGLFQGMFEKNMLTFNPGWDQDAAEVNPFTDVRELQKALKDQGAVFVQEAYETGEGLTSLVIGAPDGNTILVDQHR